VEICHNQTGYADYDSKREWLLDTFKPVQDFSLKQQCCDLGLQAYRAVNCQVIGRIDLRLDSSDSPQLLEINPNPALYNKNCSMPLIAEQAGLSYPQLFATIINIASQRWSLPD
jgi:D-alanine-D-alanine ligase-like ATP-grasp enzyme